MGWPALDVANADPDSGGRPPASPSRGLGPSSDAGAPPSDEDPADDEGELGDVQRSALRHETRRAIFELVARTPGLNKRQVANRVGVDRSLAHQHLERLEAYNLVVLLPSAREDDEKLCFHPDHAHLWEHEDTRILYGQAPLRQVALYVQDNPGTSTAEIEATLEAAARTVQEHLAALREHGLVERHRFRRRVEHHPTDTLEAWVEEVGECYGRPWMDDG